MRRPTFQPSLKWLLALLIFSQFAVTGISLASGVADSSLLSKLRKLPGTDNFIPEQVSGIVQSEDGFIWIGTQDMGLFRFDGKRYKQYKTDSNNPDGVAHNSIYQLYIDRQGKLWLFYVNGEFDVFDPGTEKVRHLSAETGISQKIAKLKVGEKSSPSFWHSRSLFEDEKNRIWIVADSYVACINEAGRGSVRFYISAWPGILPSSILSVNQTPSGNLLLVTIDEIVETNAANHIVRRTRLPLPMSDRSNRYYNSMNFRKGDTLYVAFRAGVVAYHIGSGSFHLRGGLPAGCIDVKTVTSPASDRFLFYEKSRPNRLYEFVAGSAGFKSLGSYTYSTDSLWNDEKLFYLYDRHGNLWHGQFGSGISYGRIKKQPFVLQKLNYDPTLQVLEELMKIPTNISRRIKVLPGYPVVGTPSGAALYIDSKHRFAPFIPAPYGTNKFKPTSRWTVNVEGDNTSILTDDRWSNGNLWVYDNLKEELLTIDTLGRSSSLNLRLPSRATVQSFRTSGNNTCWMTFVNLPGLALFQQGKGLVKHITTDNGKHPLPNVQLLTIIRDNFNEHIFWITTAASGLLRFDERDESWELLGEKEGFTSDLVGGYLQDRLGFFWYTRKSGLYRFDSRSRTHLRIVSADRVNIPDFNFQGNMGHLLENEIYWLNNDYLMAIKTDSLEKAADVAIALTGLQINNETVEVGDSSRMMPQAINSLPQLKLAYDQNFLQFEFAALEFNQPGDVRYRYQLEGIDKAWVNNGTSNKTQYTSLPPGRYLFKVNATNEDGTWSKEIKSILIIISPPWWRTWWMYVLYLAAILGAGWLFMKARLRRLQLHQQVLLKQKEAEQAQAMEETKSRFFANITHELRTPLTLIMSPVQHQLQEDPATYSPRLLKGVYRNSQILLRLINQLLDMSKLESRRMVITFSRGNPVFFIDELLHSFRQQAAARNISLNYSYDDLKEDRLFDSDKLEKIIYNLVGNAMKFTGDGGSITISVREAEGDGSVTITVTDTGVGIEPDHLPHVFERFYQVNNSSTRKYEGTGIGLALVKELVELMGGKINASSSPGQGSVFTVSLPLTVAGEHITAPLVAYENKPDQFSINIPDTSKSTAIHAANKPLILIADDNEDLRQFLVDSLSVTCTVLCAANGQEGLQTANAELPDLIISDVMMPVMDGFSFCREIKETPLTSHIGFVLLTAKTSEENRLGGLRLGADYYLNKPFTVEELLLVINNLIRRQQKLQEHYSRQLQPAEAMPIIVEVEDKFLRAVYDVIEKNLDSDKLDVEFLASEMAVSRRTLNRKLAAIGNTSANEVIRHYRLKKAAALLLTGEAVSNVAYATGFSTPSWFSQSFKELYGLSPVQYVEAGGRS